MIMKQTTIKYTVLLISFFSKLDAFTPNHLISKFSLSENMSTNDDDGPTSGSFFNAVPKDDDKKKDGKTSSLSKPDALTSSSLTNPVLDSFDESFAALKRRRNSKPRANSPSTVNGVLTSKATGFGKKMEPKIINKTKTAVSAKKASVVNDVNNLEYDDQGFTLYADEETGEKKRVFEALIDYPCEFPIKIVGKNEGSFVMDIIEIISESCETSSKDIKYSERINGKWISITVQAPVKDAVMLYALYEQIDRDPRVKFKF